MSADVRRLFDKLSVWILASAGDEIGDASVILFPLRSICLRWGYLDKSYIDATFLLDRSRIVNARDPSAIDKFKNNWLIKL